MADAHAKTFKNPGFEAQFVALLEDLGIVAPMTGYQYKFSTAMNAKALFVPDAVIDLIVLFTLAYTALQLKLF